MLRPQGLEGHKVFQLAAAFLPIGCKILTAFSAAVRGETPISRAQRCNLERRDGGVIDQFGVAQPGDVLRDV